MKKNMGTVDRTLRLLIALVIVVLYLANQITGTAAIILGIFAVVFLLTSAMAFCPLYVPFKISTKKKDDPKA
jgi:Na+(H+)/acetate symporter ActP